MADHPVEPTGNFSPDNSDSAWLRRLAAIDGTDLPLVGGKAYRLAVLRQNQLNVPPGLVLTTRFFETQLKHARLTPLWTGSPDVAVTAEALAWLADALKTRPLAQPLARALNASLTAEFGPDVASFAVRSSVIDEDQRDHTFAGIHLTELGVPRSALPIAISRCWASALSGAAIEYRQVNGMSIQAIKIAVLIQPMLAPEFSGVGFTANPLTGSRTELVIEAAPGLGSAVVSGQVQPHFLRCANQPPDYPLLEERPGAVPVELTATDRVQLARQLQQIEALIGQPQDVEWARQAGQFFILQTRPVALPPAPPQTGNTLWGRDTFTGWPDDMPAPYFGSMLERAQPQMRQAFLDAGFAADLPEPCQRLIYGRLYLNLTLLRQAAARLGLSPDRLLAGLGYAAKTPLPGGFDWRAAWQARHIYRRGNRLIRELQPAIATLQVQLDDFAAGQAVTAADWLNQLRRQAELFAATARLKLSAELAGALLAHLAQPAVGAPAPAWLAALKRALARPLRARLETLRQTRQAAAALQANVIAACRSRVLALAEEWQARQWLSQPEDIFWLKLDEIERVLTGGEAVAITLKSSVQARRETHQLYAGAAVPFTLSESELASLRLGQPPAGDTADAVVGMPVSPGQTRGTIAVVTHPEQAPLFDRDTILVVPSTGPDWLPLLHHAVGLIVETGGLLSHGSVSAREYGLPAVANIPNATHRFRTGDRVLLDGSTGVVQFLEAAPAASFPADH